MSKPAFLEWILEVLYLPFQAIEETRLLRHARGGKREVNKIKMSEVFGILILLISGFISISIGWLITTSIVSLFDFG